MWFWRRSDTVETARKAQAGCRRTLVVHADGVLACAEASCSTAFDSHQWWVPCSALESPCGCLGDEYPIELLSRAA